MDDKPLLSVDISTFNSERYKKKLPVFSLGGGHLIPSAIF